MKKLRTHKEFDKIEKFHVVAIVMAVVTILGMGMLVLHGVATLMTAIDRWWPLWWMWDAVCNLFLLIVLMIFPVLASPIFGKHRGHYVSVETLQ